jgi:hypothetical protein
MALMLWLDGMMMMMMTQGAFHVRSYCAVVLPIHTIYSPPTTPYAYAPLLPAPHHIALQA